jgi:hypothetical protein
MAAQAAPNSLARWPNFADNNFLVDRRNGCSGLEVSLDGNLKQFQYNKQNRIINLDKIDQIFKVTLS